MKNSYIKKYLSFLSESYVSSIEANKHNESFVKTVSDRLEVVRQISTQLDWQELAPEEKQASRLEWIASYKKRGFDVARKQEIAELYSILKSCLPHMLVVNQNGRLDSFIELCYNLCEIIDFKGRAFDQITKSDIITFNAALGEVDHLSHPLLQDSVEEVIKIKIRIEEIFDLK